jgi:rod shape-determining protein MreD
MRWSTALATLIVALVLDVSFTGVLELAGVTPRLMCVVVAFAAMHADAAAVRWYALLSGFLVDLSEPSMAGPRAPLYLIAPWTLGVFFGSEAVLSLRGVVVRKNPLAVGVLSCVLALAAGLFWTAWWAFRSWYPDSPAPWGGGSALGEFGMQLLTAMSTGVCAVPVGWVLLRTSSIWGFPSVISRQRGGGQARIIRE